jgi:uncharacterized surface protein with fasciclin (FAS1) repeats
MRTSTLLACSLLLGACAAKTDAAPPSPPDTDEAASPAAPEPAAAAEPEAAEPEAKPEPEAAKPAGGDVLAVVAKIDGATIFNELLGLSDAAKGLHSTDGAGYTLLVPTDAAFAKLPKGTVDRLKKNQAELDRLVKAHMVLGSNDVGKLSNFRTAPTADGKEVEVKVQEVDMLIGGGKLVETDLKATNGYVHVIDKVLTLSKK